MFMMTRKWNGKKIGKKSRLKNLSAAYFCGPALTPAFHFLSYSVCMWAFDYENS